MNGVFLLVRDHFDLSTLLRRLEQAPAAEKLQVADELLQRWEAHGQAAQVFYAAVGGWAWAAGQRVTVQHESIAALLRDVAANGLHQATWDGLRQQVEEHVREEQTAVFPEARRRLNAEALDDIGRRMEAPRSGGADEEEPPERLVEAMAQVAAALSKTLESVLDVGGGRRRRRRRRATAGPAAQRGAAPRARRRP